MAMLSRPKHFVVNEMNTWYS